jgi:hypothetical protein
MQNALNTRRNPIGFKVTDNKLMVIDQQNTKIDINPFTAQDEALLKMVVFIHNLMKKRASMFVNKEPFCKTEKEKIEDFLNKVYIKYYEHI